MNFILSMIAAAWFLGLALPAAAADAPSATAAGQAFGRSAVLGLQLAVKRGQRDGKFSDTVVDCVGRLKPDTFTDVFDSVLASELTEEERKTTEAFFSSPIGRKYSKYDLLQVYRAVGEEPPEALPQFTDTEMGKIKQFGSSPAGVKLVKEKILEKAAAQPIGQRVKELLAQCSGQKK